MAIRKGLERVVDLAGEILAFFTIALILLLYINGHFGFLPQDLTNTLSVVREIAIIAVVGLKGLEFALKGRLIRMIIFLVLFLGVIIFMFFPGSVPGWLIP